MATTTAVEITSMKSLIRRVTATPSFAAKPAALKRCRNIFTSSPSPRATGAGPLTRSAGIHAPPGRISQVVNLVFRVSSDSHGAADLEQAAVQNTQGRPPGWAIGVVA